MATARPAMSLVEESVEGCVLTNDLPIKKRCNDMDDHLLELERRLCILEQTVTALKTDLPPAIDELREVVGAFRRRLNESENFSFINEYKDKMGLPGHQGSLNSIHPYWRHVKYRRKVREEVDEIVSQYRGLCVSDITEETKKVLRLPTFNTWNWQDSELLLLLEHMYQDLNLTERFSIDLEVLRSFLFTVYLNYNQVPFHNFRHAFSVAQMMYGMIWECNLQSRLSDVDVLFLLTSSICHDLDHPGFNNIYQINAKTELALRYNDISPLENHHCAVTFSILEKSESNIFRNLTNDEYKEVREGVIRCILATDMARHNEILQEFKEAVPNFDFKDKTHANLLFMILIKVADISNEARPLDIAEPWLECLMQEFFNQSDLEKLEGLPVSPFMDREKVTKPSSQCSFIGFVLLPLFEALGDLLPQLDELMLEPVRVALAHYRRLNETSKKNSEEKEDKEAIEEEEEEDDEEEDFQIEAEDQLHRENEEASSPTKLKKILSKTESFTSLRSRASSKGSGLFRGANSRDTDPDLDPTETEVEVSERTSKFKISTDASRRNSYDRKGSIDRRCSVERTVSPRMLDERLRTHKEAVEHHSLSSDPSEEDQDKENRLEDRSFLSRVRHFTEHVTSFDADRVIGEQDKQPDRISPTPKQGVLKRKKDKAGTTEEQNSENFASKMRITFASATAIEVLEEEQKGSSLEELKSEENPGPPQGVIRTNKTIGPKKLETSVCCCEESPTHSENSNTSLPNSFLRHKKKFSLSLDVLPRRNGRPKKDALTTTDAQRVSSDDFLLRSPAGDVSLKVSHHSPKVLKKKHESAKAILLRSISFRKKPTLVAKDVCSLPIRKTSEEKVCPDL